MKVISLNGTDCKLELIHQNRLKTLILDHPVYPKTNVNDQCYYFE
jgi:hypothetical protein